MTPPGGRSGLRVAVMAALAKEHGGFGRTALMKLVYFLQVLRGVPLGYQFRLYTYGPYDPQVLDDLKIAELSGAVSVREVRSALGAGYAISAGHAAEEALGNALLQQYRPAIAAISAEFAARPALDLEMASTIVFVDRSETEAGNRSSPRQIAKKVKTLKPRLNEVWIEQEARAMQSKSYLRSVA